MDSAKRSNAIVSSLFPAAVQSRLFKKQLDDRKTQKSRNVFSALTDGPKLRIKTFLNDEEAATRRNGNIYSDKSEMPDADAEAPIADLFPHTTVMFADIAGFTAWSSVREPTQVFVLLETVYKNFDRIAKRRRIFKVET